MDKPSCRLCGHKHWGNEEHVFEKSTVDAKVQRPSAPASSSKVLGVGPDSSGKPKETSLRGKSLSATQRVYEWRLNNKERYNAYQKELMRRRRNG